ncbi:hypothetical protein C8Q80DRAFT_1123976 [Daedaleopsis nitida]|nr:hypothetical protein C8Q80DRAFT_1123976 [Daedaleopsis nitida]
MSSPKFSDSQETLLPMPVQAAEPRRTFTMWTPLAAMFPTSQAAIAAEYEHLTCASEEELLKPSSPTTGSVGGDSDELAPAPDTVLDAALGAIWYLRMLLLLTLLCAAATLVSGLVALFLSSFVVLGWFAPFNTVSGAALYAASAAGAPVLGASVGALAFLILVARRLRMSRAQRVAVDAAAENNGTRRSRSSDSDSDSEPVELQVALVVAVVAGAFALAAGMGVLPGLVPADAPFKVRHAVTLGVWGLFVPVMPLAVGALVSTLWRCDPEAGAEAVVLFPAGARVAHVPSSLAQRSVGIAGSEKGSEMGRETEVGREVGSAGIEMGSDTEGTEGSDKGSETDGTDKGSETEVGREVGSAGIEMGSDTEGTEGSDKGSDTDGTDKGSEVGREVGMAGTERGRETDGTEMGSESDSGTASSRMGRETEGIAPVGITAGREIDGITPVGTMAGREIDGIAPVGMTAGREMEGRAPVGKMAGREMDGITPDGRIPVGRPRKAEDEASGAPVGRATEGIALNSDEAALSA